LIIAQRQWRRLACFYEFHKLEWMENKLNAVNLLIRA